MGDSTLVLGRIIICMDMGYTLGGMEGDMRGTMRWIRNTGLEYILGLMEGNMRVIGLMESSMGKESIYYLMG